MPKKIQDPFLEREAKKYSHPIPSREIILQLLSEQDGPPQFDELAELLKLKTPDDLEALRRRVKAMERDGQLVRNRGRAYLPTTSGDLIRGRVLAYPDGFGFLSPDGGGEDLFLSPREMRALMHGDRIVARVTGIGPRGRKQAAMVEVLERACTQLVGRYMEERGIGFVHPEDKRQIHDILIPREYAGKAQPGQIVEVKIVVPPSISGQAIGEITEILGEHMAPGMEVDIAVRAYGLPHKWPEGVLEESKSVPARVPKKEMTDRVDLRELPFVTIDGADARDFDDAVYCETKESGGWLLYVAIADVSAYVKPGSAMDEEARLRGTSVYFPGEVIPMLPEVLSNGLCSLMPDEERLAMVCEMDISSNGAITGYRFAEAVILSHARLTYDEAAEIIVDRSVKARKLRSEVAPHLDELYALFKALHKARQRRGAIDFDSVETRIVFGEQRKIERIEAVVRNDAHKLIEECMIAANVATAKFLEATGMPVIYRIHPPPSEDKREDLRSFLSELALTLPGGKDPKPGDYVKLLDSIRGRPDAHLIQTVLLRSLTQAVYSPEEEGHFGLALESYTHFTSPIRRYPDLLVHRAIRRTLRGKRNRSYPYDRETVVQLGIHCSMCERRADDATRDAMSWLKCEYMKDRVGEDFDGIVSGVTSFGLFVELKEVYVDGLVHISELPKDYYHFDPAGHRLSGERSGRVFRLGDPVSVKVVRVSLDDRKIDLLIAGAAAGKAEKPLEKPAKKRSSRNRRSKRK